MSRVSFTIGLIGTALAAAGCTIATRPAVSTPAVTPMSTARHGAGHGDAHYALGRYYQGQVRYDEAIRAYQEVLDAQPNHADAHNALGVIHAIQGRYVMAETELRTALRLAPGAAHIQNNLGYALLLQGYFAEAISAFEKALLLEPGQARAADNLRIAQARLAGRSEPSAPAPVPVKAASLKPQRSMVAEVEPTLRVRAVTANVIELRLPAQSRNERKDPLPAQSPIRLEVANGNGVGGLARQTSAYLKGIGYGPVRLTNQKPFTLGRTEIQFRPGFQQQAQRLQAALAGKGVLAPSGLLRQDIQVRVVLGKDLRTAAQLAEIEEVPIRLARNGE